jgi:hypothetical protein
MCGRPVLPDAPIVTVHAAAWFIINLFIYWYRLQIKWDHKEKLNRIGRKSTTRCIYALISYIISVRQLSWKTLDKIQASDCLSALSCGMSISLIEF